jgi:TolB protein
MQVTDLSGIESKPSLSPDGKTVAFVSRADGDFDVYVQRVGGHNPINLTPDCAKDDSGPAFSPDGERIAFHSECEGGGLFVMGATGESRRKLADAGHDPSWSPDGGKLVVASEALVNPLARRGQSVVSVLDLASGASRRLIEQDAVQPSWSPDGRRIAFWGLRGGMGGGGTRDLWTVAAEGGEPVDVTKDPHLDWNPAWSADGRHLYFASGRGGTLNLWRVAIDGATGRTSGAPEAVTTPSRKIGSFSLSRDGGRLAFEARDDRSALYRVALDPEHGRLAGTPQLVLGGSRDIASLALSPNGEWVAFSSTGLQENVFIVRLDGTGYRQLTDDSFRNRGPGWSADGSVIGFYSNRSGRYEVWTMRPDGSGITQLTQTQVGSSWYPEWSFDGSRIAVAGMPTTRLLDITKPIAERVVLDLPPMPDGTTFHGVSWSGDGTRLAGMELRRDGSSAGIWLYHLDSGRYERVSSSGRIPHLLADGRRLVYNDDGRLRFLDTASGRSAEILSIGWSNQVNNREFRITRDGRQIVFVRAENEADIWMMSPE